MGASSQGNLPEPSWGLSVLYPLPLIFWEAYARDTVQLSLAHDIASCLNNELLETSQKSELGALLGWGTASPVKPPKVRAALSKSCPDESSPHLSLT